MYDVISSKLISIHRIFVECQAVCLYDHITCFTLKYYHDIRAIFVVGKGMFTCPKPHHVGVGSK